jgi:RimJ/RimL family protein N-acetyltransferase
VILFETARLLFRSHQAEDLDAFAAMQGDVEVRRYVGGRAWPREEAMERFQPWIGKPARSYGFWATILKEEQQYIGYCGLAKHQDGIHLGYYIARPYWRRGLGAEAARGFVDFGFGTLRLPHLVANVDRRNGRSQRILEQLGFRIAGREQLANGRVIVRYKLNAPHIF